MVSLHQIHNTVPVLCYEKGALIIKIWKFLKPNFLFFYHFRMFNTHFNKAL